MSTEHSHIVQAIRAPVGSRIAVAMSGGVDSSTVAALLVEAGYEVVGLTARLYDVAEDEIAARKAGSCCAPEDARDARTVAQQLGMRHYVLDEREVFAKEVIAPFVADWQAGRTPNPCVQCNRSLKFDRLLAMALRLGCVALATGHYARLEPDADGVLRLRGGVDPGKDQAYFLWPMTPAAAAHLRFPLGGWTKAEVREAADRLGLEVATKPESMDICFVGPQSAQQYVEAQVGRQAGPLVDTSGRVVGQHKGIAGLTIGQRHGLGLPPAQPDAAPLYVVDKRADGVVTVGPRSLLRATRLHVTQMQWLGDLPFAGAKLAVQVRHRGQRVACTVVHATAHDAELAVDGELYAAAAGQSAVLWSEAGVDGYVVGGGVLTTPAQPSLAQTRAAGAAA